MTIVLDKLHDMIRDVSIFSLLHLIKEFLLLSNVNKLIVAINFMICI